MLFYETEGKFGDDDFKITANSLFLLDIGSKAYTEYDPADAELIKFLGSHPEVLSQKKGHIHSHNTMDVFFSGTDTEELADNCKFHNFYLSLIVNNKNEMCAKIAFRAKTRSVNRITMTFLDEKGKEREKNLNSEKEEEVIYVYKCNIIKPEEGEVGDSFTSRFQELKKANDEKLVKKASEAAKSKVIWDTEYYSQAGLFDDTRFPYESAEKSKGGKKKSIVERGKCPTDSRAYSMLAKLVSMDFLYEGTLGGALEKMDKELYPEEYKGEDDFTPHLYYDAIEKRVVEFYIDSFPEDTVKLVNFEAVMEKCIEVLGLYENVFPELVENLIESLNLEIK